MFLNTYVVYLHFKSIRVAFFTNPFCNAVLFVIQNNVPLVCTVCTTVHLTFVNINKLIIYQRFFG